MSNLPPRYDPRLVLIARNPTAGRGPSADRVTSLARALEARGFEVVVESNLEQISEIAKRVREQHNLRAVVCAGGCAAG